MNVVELAIMGQAEVFTGDDRSMQGQHSRRRAKAAMATARRQNSFFGMMYERLTPADHLLRRIAAAVDFGFVSELVSDCYCPDKGLR